MNSYVLSEKYNNIVFKHYNKRYTTPPVFEEYSFNTATCITNLVISFVFLTMIETYRFVYIFDVVLAIFYTFTLLFVRESYRSGVLNASVLPETAGYKFARYIAILSQGAVYRITLPTIYFIVNFANVTFITASTFALMCAIAFCIGSIVPMSTFGLFAKKKFYTKSAQKVYRAILEGPQAYNADIDVLMKNSLDFKIVELKNPQLANAAYFKAQENFVASAETIRRHINNYDVEWRRALMFGGYETEKHFVLNPVNKSLTTLLHQHKVNAEALNKIINELNSQNISPIHKPFAITGSKRRNSNNNNSNNSRPIEDVWNSPVNWYN